MAPETEDGAPSLEEFARRRRAEGYYDIADSIDYLLANQDQFTSGQLDIGDLPLDPSHELMFRIGIFVGSRFEKRTADRVDTPPEPQSTD